MEPGGGGQIAAAISGSAAGVDRLSALPDDLLAQILRPLGTPDAIRTSLVSQRWRRVWSLLPELHVPSLPGDPIRFRDALAAHQVRLRFLQVLSTGGGTADPKSISIWLPAAAARVSGNFALVVNQISPAAEAAEEEGWDGIVDLPCFQDATGIMIRLGHLGLAVPPPAAGVFARLVSLRLECVWFDDPSELEDVIASRCPCLQHLRLCHTLRMYTLTVSSKTLLKMELEELQGVWELIVDTPELRELIVSRCLLDDDPIAVITAPRLESLEWKYSAGEIDESVELGEMLHLRSLGKLAFFVYGLHDLSYNRTTVQFLQRFRAIETLKLMLGYLPEINIFQYLMEEMNVLPDLAILHLMVDPNGHAFGAGTFHVLKMCTRIRKLILELSGSSDLEEPNACGTGCICAQQTNWQSEEFLFARLQEVEIRNFRGSDHEDSVVKRLFESATAMRKLKVTFDVSVTESKARELCHMFESFVTTPGVCMDFRYRNHTKV
ncbi:unnamed protein product [Urochloa decumbens]|uniref:F-box domain-containing protein n=1 Tax=Urochloa decumbens TaxID=240449 RepID=A0ABC9GDI0_9POAL